MPDLELKGPLDLNGNLNLVPPDGGKVLVNGAEALVEGKAEGTAPVVAIPPPPSAPADSGTKVVVVSSLGKTVTVNNEALVTTGMVLQGNTWPGMVLPSTRNTGATVVNANVLPVNVVGDRVAIFPNGGSATIGKSGQG
ncbi:hypothetical protein [Actinopolymorpha pittospori]|uniref:Uncharacterized protein n=1 Tax=Actinopolymorpha pittospori TaxID=648752 RepID=A0A927N4F0_9ACTN|nr:hypothetical protein [Actinopolymorpha pittospori]MBE1610108.1 hypothetical protein [Actinopolymorpha pittospori]